MAIVCGTDFSEAAGQAMRAAAALAQRLGERVLWVVHVVDATVEKTLEGPALERLRTELEQRLRAAGEAVAAPGVEVRAALRFGAPASRLAAFAAEEHASLVVVGSQGHERDPLYRLGGTSERLAVVADVPALVVRDAGPFVAWAAGRRKLQVLVGLDWGSTTDAAVAVARRLVAAGGCTLIAAHVYQWGEAARFGLPATSWGDPDPALERLIERDLVARLGDLAAGTSIRLRARGGSSGRIGEDLVALAEQEGADLMLVGSRRRRGLRRLTSVSSGALHGAPMSVLCAPAAGQQATEAARAATEPRRFSRVLVPTDLSPVSNAAVPYAYALVGEQDAEVTLLHIGAEASEARRAALAQLVPRHAQRPEILTRLEVESQNGGDVASAILAAAARLGADAVCMATHGHGLRRALLGSVAEAVVAKSPVPVLLVRAER